MVTDYNDQDDGSEKTHEHRGYNDTKKTKDNRKMRTHSFGYVGFLSVLWDITDSI